MRILDAIHIKITPEIHKVKILAGFKILSLDVLDDLIIIWYEVNKEASEITHYFSCCKTGDSLRPWETKINFIGTVKVKSTYLHVFNKA